MTLLRAAVLLYSGMISFEDLCDIFDVIPGTEGVFLWLLDMELDCLW